MVKKFQTLQKNHKSLNNVYPISFKTQSIKKVFTLHKTDKIHRQLGGNS